MAALTTEEARLLREVRAGQHGERNFNSKSDLKALAARGLIRLEDNALSRKAVLTPNGRKALNDHTETEKTRQADEKAKLQAEKAAQSARLKVFTAAVLDAMKDPLEKWRVDYLEAFKGIVQKYEEWAAGVEKPAHDFDRHRDKGSVYNYLKAIGADPNVTRAAMYHPLYPFRNMGRITFKNVLPSLKKQAAMHIQATNEKMVAVLTTKLSDVPDTVTTVETNRLNFRQGEAEGVWYVTFDSGERRSVETRLIYAGGYNIQKLHTRYLVRVRELEPVAQAKAPVAEEKDARIAAGEKRSGLSEAEFRAIVDIHERKIISEKHAAERPEVSGLIKRGLVRVKEGTLRVTQDGSLAYHKFNTGYMKAAIEANAQARTATKKDAMIAKVRAAKNLGEIVAAVEEAFKPKEA